VSVFNEEPTTEFLQRAQGYYSDAWSDARDQWKGWDSLYDLNWDIWPDSIAQGQQRTKYHTSKARSIIDHATATLLAYSPRFKRTPVKDTEEHKESADRLEKGMKAVLDDASLQETSLPWKLNGTHMLKYGYGVMKQDLALTEKPKQPKQSDFTDDEEFEAAAEDYKATRFNWNPIKTVALNPGRVLLDPESKNSEVAFEKKAMLVHQIESLMERKKAARRKVDFDVIKDLNDPFATQDIIEYWSPRWHAVQLSGGGILYTERNTWGFTPYAHAFAGFGSEPVDDGGPEFLAIGILFAVSDTLKMQSQSVNASMTLLIRAAYANLGYTGDNYEAAVQVARNGIMQGDKDDWWVMPSPEMSNWMFQVEFGLDRDIEEGTYPRSISGIREQGVTTVGQQAILLTQSRQKFQEVAVQNEHMATTISQNVLRLMDGKRSPIAPKIGANGVEVRKSDIYGHYHMQASFEVADPVLDLQRRELGIREVEAGLKDTETYWEEDARVEDITERTKRLLKHVIRNTPGVQVELAREVAEEMGFKDVFERALAAEQAQSAALPSANGQAVVPGLEGGGLDGTAQAANQLRQPLADNTAKPGQVNGTEFSRA
jgi:hypothetical protein